MSRARLQWLCRRGMQELDLLLQPYLDRSYDRAGPSERSAFLRLLGESDDALWRYFYAGLNPGDPALVELVHKIRRTAAPHP